MYYWIHPINLGWSFVLIRGHRLLFSNFIVFLSLNIVFVLANSADPDKMLFTGNVRYPTSDLGSITLKR